MLNNHGKGFTYAKERDRLITEINQKLRINGARYSVEAGLNDAGLYLIYNTLTQAGRAEYSHTSAVIGYTTMAMCHYLDGFLTALYCDFSS